MDYPATLNHFAPPTVAKQENTVKLDLLLAPSAPPALTVAACLNRAPFVQVRYSLQLSH